MLTRLKVTGFKNLLGIDLPLGPFTCIAGANGVGKSNLLDAIGFLSALADRPLIDAALCVRDEGGRTGDIRTLFHRVGSKYSDKMEFEAEMIVPQLGFDDLGQPAKATITFLKYSLSLGYRADESFRGGGGLEILKEELTHIPARETPKHLWFPTSLQWRKSAIAGQRSAPFISTEGDGANRVIKIHQDGRSGRARMLAAGNLPRTVISATNAAETPTATLARREMQSWRLLQLEPSSLRAPDDFTSPTRLGSDGSHLPSTLYRMGRPKTPNSMEVGSTSRTNPVYARVANRLSNLIDDVREVSVDRDEKRELLTLSVTGRDGTIHPARALSDGTLRFLALAVLDLDPDAQGLLCLEEPENGIHPSRIPAILELLMDVAVDSEHQVGQDNPLRQVIVNTHSPLVVAQVPDDSLVVADLKERVDDGIGYKVISFACLPETWRARVPEAQIVPRGRVLEYLTAISRVEAIETYESAPPKIKRVVDRSDLQYPMLYGE